MTPAIFVINLDRSTDRWERVSRSAKPLDIRRVRGIPGEAIPRAEWRHVAPLRFELSHGRVILPGEYGCYQSHLRALEIVRDENLPSAIVAEDDVVLPSDLPERAAALLDASSADVMKLVSHRVRSFIRRGVSGSGDEFGRCVHGPMGSAACYAVTNRGARQLAERLRTMWLPWDIALERGWDTGATTFTTLRPLVKILREGRSTVAEHYEVSKLPAWQRLPAAAFRAEDYLRRAAYARWGA